MWQQMVGWGEVAGWVAGPLPSSPVSDNLQATLDPRGHPAAGEGVPWGKLGGLQMEGTGRDAGGSGDTGHGRSCR